MLVPHDDIVEILHFERHMVQASLLTLNGQEDMMVGILFAAVNTIECRNCIILWPRIDIIRTDETEHFTKPVGGSHYIRGPDHRVPEAFNLRGAF